MWDGVYNSPTARECKVVQTHQTSTQKRSALQHPHPHGHIVVNGTTAARVTVGMEGV